MCSSLNLAEPFPKRKDTGMSRPLEGFRVALAEGRQLDELAAMLAAEGGVPVRHPLVSILDAPDQTPVKAWLEQLIAGQFDLVIFFTGEGVNRLLEAADREGLKTEVIASLSQLPILTRGPKPVRALKELGLVPQHVATPPTTDGVIAALRQMSLRGQRVGVQLYGPDNPPLAVFLKEQEAQMLPVTPYIYAPAEDAQRVVELIQALASRTVDAICFTSSPQVTRLVEVATEHSLNETLAEGMKQTCVAAVGPIMAETLQHHGFRVDVCPEQGFVMKNLVQYLKRFREQRGRG
jgi:uroporphyrinogen-III synthase